MTSAHHIYTACHESRCARTVNTPKHTCSGHIDLIPRTLHACGTHVQIRTRIYEYTHYIRIGRCAHTRIHCRCFPRLRSSTHTDVILRTRRILQHHPNNPTRRQRTTLMNLGQRLHMRTHTHESTRSAYNSTTRVYRLPHVTPPRTSYHTQHRRGTRSPCNVS